MKKIYLLFAFTYLLTNASLYAQYTKLFNFESATSGAHPKGSLFLNGNFLYGMTLFGGTNNLGTIFKIKPDGTGYIKLLDFEGTTNGSIPYGSFVSDGTFLYGMTQQGGAHNLGTLFKIMPDGTGYAKLLDFAGTSNGGYPNKTLIFDGTFLYGMTAAGGTNDSGIIFKLKPDGSDFVMLMDFADGTNGRFPEGPLLLEGDFLYGLTLAGGTQDRGTIFKIKPDGTGYVKLLNFSSGSNGNTPRGSLVSDGTFLYGMNSYGGTNNRGTVFKIKPNGTGYKKILDFGVDSDADIPVSSLLFDGTFLYGTTSQGGANNSGTMFKILPDGTGYEKLLDFDGATNGSSPYSPLISDGSFLYGMTSSGGTNDHGVIFKFDITMIAGITETNAVPEIAIYPNPTKDIINVSTSVNGVQVVSITNILGEIVLSQEANLVADSSFTIDLSEQQAGIYFLRIGNLTQKLIKQ